MKNLNTKGKKAHIFTKKMGSQLKFRERLEFIINNGVNDIEKLIKMTGASRRTVFRVKSRVNSGQGIQRKEGIQRKS